MKLCKLCKEQLQEGIDSKEWKYYVCQNPDCEINGIHISKKLLDSKQRGKNETKTTKR